MIAFADAAMKSGRFIVDASFPAPVRAVAGKAALLARVKIDVDEESEIGRKTLARVTVELQNRLLLQATPGTLIGQRGIREAVAQNDLVLGQRRTNDLLHILGAAGKVKQQLRARPQLCVLRIQQNLPNLKPYAGAARLNGLHNWLTGLAQTVRQQAQLRSLTATIDPFERDEDPRLPHP